MDIRESIRQAMREAKTPSKWSPYSQPNLSALDMFLRKAGYYLVDVVSHDSSSDEVIIEPIKPSYLYPEIIHDLTDNSFSIKIDKTGLYHVSDMEELIKGYTTAVGVAKHLNSLDLSKLEINLDEE